MLGLRLGPAEVRFTGRDDGDFRDAFARDDERRAVVDRPWVTVHQVHGARVVSGDRTTAPASIDADAIVTTDRDIAVAVKTADCAPVVLAGQGNVVGIVHAGWRGLAAGVVGAAVEEMRASGAGSITAALGPCIHAECYEFGGRELDAVAVRFGDGVRATTSAGSPALNLPAAVRAALGEQGVELVHDAAQCTACDASRWWSHRARGEAERQATVAWIS